MRDVLALLCSWGLLRQRQSLCLGRVRHARMLGCQNALRRCLIHTSMAWHLYSKKDTSSSGCSCLIGIWLDTDLLPKHLHAMGLLSSEVHTSPQGLSSS